MNAKMLDDAINGIRPELIEEAEKINAQDMNNETSDGEVHVQGVEVYRRPIWKNILVIASAIVVCGLATGGAFLMKNIMTKPGDVFDDSDQDIIITEQNSVETNLEEVVPTEETTEVDETTANAIEFRELQLHNSPCYVDTMEEAKALINEHSITIPWEERKNYRIDVNHYAKRIQSEGHDLNSLESKSFIYHMLRNSFLYFDSAMGTIGWYSSFEGRYFNPTADFQIDLQNQEGYSKCINDSDDVYLEFYAYNDKIITKENFSEVYQEEEGAKAESIILPEDNYRYIEISPPDYGFNKCPSCSINCAWNKVHDELMPEELALSYLDNFDSWKVNCISEHLGRTAVELSGVYNDGSELKMTVDIYTGIMLKLSIENSNTDFVDKREVTALQVDIPIERVEFDPSGLTKRSYK